MFEPGIFSTKMVICPLCHYEGLPAAEGDERNLRLGIMHLGISSISDDEGVLELLDTETADLSTSESLANIATPPTRVH